MKIYTILLIFFLFMGQAWAGDVIENDLDIADDTALVFSDPANDWSLEWSVEAPDFWEIEYVQSDGQRIKMSEIRALLERCQELLSNDPVLLNRVDGERKFVQPYVVEGLLGDIEAMLDRLE